MESKIPTISVIMPVFNGERYLSDAINSILNQSYKQFEFIILNDGSTDSTEEIIESFKDPRIIYLKNETNRGLSYSFNLCISRATGNYIARMDADDISTNERLQKQINYLESNPTVDLVGSAAFLINENNKVFGTTRRPKVHNIIKWQSLFSTPLIHPTVMGRTAIFKNNPYSESLLNSEDYELWSRLLFGSNTRFGNLVELLIKYRVYSKSFTRSLSGDKRLESANNTISNIEHYIELTSTDKDLITEIRLNKGVSITNLLKLWFTYFRVTQSFIKKEKVSTSECVEMNTRLLTHLWFLCKYFLKHSLH